MQTRKVCCKHTVALIPIVVAAAWSTCGTFTRLHMQMHDKVRIFLCDWNYRWKNEKLLLIIILRVTVKLRLFKKPHAHFKPQEHSKCFRTLVAWDFCWWLFQVIKSTLYLFIYFPECITTSPRHGYCIETPRLYNPIDNSLVKDWNILNINLLDSLTLVCWHYLQCFNTIIYNIKVHMFSN